VQYSAHFGVGDFTFAHGSSKGDAEEEKSHVASTPLSMLKADAKRSMAFSLNTFEPQPGEAIFFVDSGQHPSAQKQQQRHDSS